MAAGKLNNRIKFSRAVAGDDGYGNTVISPYVEFLTVWANVRETTGKERVAGGSIENNRTATIRLRSSSQSRAVKQSDQVLARGETWDILGIANADDKGEMLDILVQNGTAK